MKFTLPTTVWRELGKQRTLIKRALDKRLEKSRQLESTPISRLKMTSEVSIEKQMQRLDREDIAALRKFSHFASKDADFDPYTGFDLGVVTENRLVEFLADLNHAILGKDQSTAHSLFFEIQSLCEELEIGDCFDIEHVAEQLELLEAEEMPLIFIPPNNIIVPSLIIPVQENLIKALQKNPEDIYKISPREFEEIVAEIFRAKGFNVDLTKSTRDGGRDIIAIHSTLDIQTKYLIECKRHSPTNKVGVGIVRQLYGVHAHERASKSIVATTSFFTKGAKEIAESSPWHLDLKDYNDVIGWINNYKTPKG